MTERHIETDCREGVGLLCDHSALAVAQRKRRLLLDQLLQVGRVDIVELPDGYAFHVDPVSIIAPTLGGIRGLGTALLSVHEYRRASWDGRRAAGVGSRRW
jgi:hypothetical protein